MKAGKRLFACFPDYEKTTPEFIATFLNVLATYETRVVDALVSPKDGLPAKCKFVPTIADMAEMATTLERRFHAEDAARAEALRKAQEFESMERAPKPGIGTDGKPCPSGCELVVKDAAWWDRRPTKLAEARKAYPEAYMDRDGWFWESEGAHRTHYREYLTAA